MIPDDVKRAGAFAMHEEVARGRGDRMPTEKCDTKRTEEILDAALAAMEARGWALTQVGIPYPSTPDTGEGQ